jgi:hypothetical protein
MTPHEQQHREEEQSEQREERSERGDRSPDSNAQAPAATPIVFDVTCYRLIATPEDSDADQDGGESRPGGEGASPTTTATSPPVLWHGTVRIFDIEKFSRNNPRIEWRAEVGERDGEAPGELKDAIASYIAKRLTSGLGSADGLVADAADKITRGINDLAENPLRDAAHGLGMPDWSSEPVAGVFAIVLTKPVVEPVEKAAKLIETVGLIIAIVTGMHPLVLAFGKPLLHDQVVGLVQKAVTAVLSPTTPTTTESPGDLLRRLTTDAHSACTDATGPAVRPITSLDPD